MLFSTKLDILGHEISSEGRRPAATDLDVITKMPRPTNISGLKQYLGMCSYFLDYIPNMSALTIHLHSLLHKDQPFVSTSEHQTEFDGLKQILIGPSVMLYHPNWGLPFEVHVDASKHGVCAMLAQNHNDHIRLVWFLLRAFSKTWSNWNTTHKELYAVKCALEQFRLYVIGSKCKVVSDRANLKWLTLIAPKQVKMTWWCVLNIEHRAVVKNVVPVTLSRHHMRKEINFLPAY